MPLAAIAVAIFINALWGGNPIAVKIGLEAFPPFWSAFLRFAIGAVCIAAWAAHAGTRLWPRLHEWKDLLWLSALFGVQIAVMNIGIDMSSGAISAVLISMFPLFAAGLSHFFVPGDRLTARRATGLFVAFLGATVIVLRGDVGGLVTGINPGDVIVLLSAALLAGRLILAANLVRRMDPARVMFWQMLIALPVFCLLAVTTETVIWERVSWVPVLGLVYQGAVIAGFGFIVNATLYRLYDPSVIVGFGFVSPVTGVLLGVWLLGDSITPSLALGTAGIGCGLILLTLGRRAAPRRWR
jgi:drug/metabolite transporter (DMT)-like permease